MDGEVILDIAIYVRITGPDSVMVRASTWCGIVNLMFHQ